jgi:hypothetical protein
MKNLKPNEIYAVSAMTIDNNTEGVKTLITKYGVILPNNASRSDIDKAFAALLRKSKSFRNDFAVLAANESQKSENFSNFMEFLGMSGRGIGTASAPLKTPDPIPVKTSLPNTTAKKPSAFAEAFDADTIRNVINTGLNIWATRSGTTAATTNDLQSGRESLNLQPQSQQTRGIGTTGIVLISIGAVAAVGVLLYYLSKNK